MLDQVVDYYISLAPEVGTIIGVAHGIHNECERQALITPSLQEILIAMLIIEVRKH